MKLLENRLHSWHPRRPSPRVKRKLFPGSREAVGLSLRWLAPSVACLFLALTIVNQGPGLSASASRPEPVIGLISSNISYTEILRDNHPASRNRISPSSFEWTNLSDFTSSVSPFSLSRMN